jgi:polyketide biosynthesis acyl carrier protein
MDRQEILQVILKHLRRNVDGLDDTEIDPSRSMAQYNASSLDIVEVVSSSMRELSIKIPRTKLSQLKCINDVVDVFYDALHAGEAATA